MKQLFLSLCLLITVASVSAQSPGHGDGYNPIKNIKMDVNYNEFVAITGLTANRDASGKWTNTTFLLNFTDEVLEVNYRIPALGVDTVFVVPPTAQDGIWWDWQEYFVGYNLITTNVGTELSSYMIEAEVNQPGYDFTLRHIWYRQIKHTSRY